MHELRIEFCLILVGIIMLTVELKVSHRQIKIAVLVKRDPASGLIAGLNATALSKGHEVSAPPRTTAIGALAYYASHANPANYQPSNITFGIMQPLVNPPKGKPFRNHALSERALGDLQNWIDAHRFESVPAVSPA